MSPEILAEYGKVIRQLRMEKGLSQEALADLCDLHRTYISDIERGRRNVSLENIQKLADALGTTITDIFSKIEHAGI